MEAKANQGKWCPSERVNQLDDISVYTDQVPSAASSI